MTSITIPDSVTEIGAYAFRKCISLSDISLPDSITKIEDYTFHRCENLTSVTIPESVTQIGGSAFTNCDNLTNIMIPSSVKVIERYALGYYLWDNDSTYDLTEGFSITGYSNSTAETYAKENGVKLEIKSVSKTPSLWTFVEITEEVEFNPEVTVNASIQAVEEKLSAAALSAEMKYTQIAFAHEGILPGKAEVALDLSEGGRFTEGAVVYLYYYNPKTTLFEKAGSAVYTNGTARFTLTHCSDYIVTSEELPEALISVNTAQKPDESTVPDSAADTLEKSDGAQTGDVNTSVYFAALLSGMAAVMIKFRKKIYR